MSDTPDAFAVLGEPLLGGQAPPVEGFAPEGERKGWGGRRRGAGRPRGSGRSDDPAKVTTKGKRPVGRPTNKATRAARVAGLYRQLGDFLVLGSALDARLYAIGEVVEQNADALGEAWAEWAETSPRIAQMLDRMSFGGGGIAVLIAHVPIVKAIMNPDPNAAAAGPGLADILGNVMAGNLRGLMVEPVEAVPE